MVLLLVLAQLTPPVSEGGLSVRFEGQTIDRLATLRVAITDRTAATVRVPLELGDRLATGTVVVVEGLPASWHVEVRRVTYTLFDAIDPSTEDDHAIVATSRSAWVELPLKKAGAPLPLLPQPRPPTAPALRAALEKRSPRFLQALDGGTPTFWTHEAAWELRFVRLTREGRTVVKTLLVDNTFGC
ncbi:MAG: hypothetical protein SFW67_08445 [Myxococcaceae bacterium]|nr:hypothetical protein [Myxococcaceae bacterium]